MSNHFGNGTATCTFAKVQAIIEYAPQLCNMKPSSAPVPE